MQDREGLGQVPHQAERAWFLVPVNEKTGCLPASPHPAPVCGDGEEKQDNNNNDNSNHHLGKARSDPGSAPSSARHTDTTPPP